MRNAKTLTVALVAVFALSAVAASGASAMQPEFASGTAKPFKSKSGVAKLKIVGGITVTCQKSTDSGSMNSPITTRKAGTVTVTFQECTAGGEECHSTAPAKAAGSGEIATNALTMELEYIVVPPATKVGVLLLPAAKKGPFTTFECKLLAGEPIVVTGGVIGEITPINALVNEFELAFTENGTTHKQEPTKFAPVSSPVEVLKTSINGAAAVESVQVLEHPDKITLESSAVEEIIALI
jgi:hypothetical protein